MDPAPVCCIGVLTTTGLPVILVLLTALLPSYVGRARAVMQKRPWRSFLLGLINFVFFALLGASVAFFVEQEWPVALGGIPGALAILVMWPLLLMTGLLIAAGVVGERLWLHIKGQQPGELAGLLRSLITGIVIMGVALLIPGFGWLFCVGLVVTGLGAAVLALFQRKPNANAEEQSAG